MSANPPSNETAQTQSKYLQWLESLKDRDPALYAELRSRLEARVARPETPLGSSPVTLETVARDSGADSTAIALETIVREGRPALPTQRNRVNFGAGFQDAAAKTIVDRLKTALPVVEPIVPLVGRIDVDNFPTSIPYLGTGWLVAQNVVVTNRHVAELMARDDNGKLRFRPGRFGETMRVAVDYRHELGSNEKLVRRVKRVLWIEKSDGPDIAFLELEESNDGVSPPFINLAKKDAAPGNEVAVVGYPARAPADIIPDQEWMDRIYGGTYDIKRVAPGLMGANNRGWATHDCTTLGGNSGSVVIDMTSGEAVALHFAGLYMIENYAVPASTIAKYLKERPWQGESVSRPIPVDGGDSPRPPRPQQPANGGNQTPAESEGGKVSVTFPLTITLSLGPALSTGAGGASTTISSSAPGTATAARGGIENSARRLEREFSVEGIYLVWPGYEIQDGRLTDTECLVVSAHPDRLEAVRQAVPTTFEGYSVEVRPASIDQQMEAAGVLEAPVASIAYNDSDRTGEGFSFNWVEEEMQALLHVGPERSWVVLSDFIRGINNEFVSSMYEFHAQHIAAALENGLNDGASLQLVLAPQSRDPKKIKEGDFDRSETFDRWEQRFKNKFDRIFVPLGSSGLVANSYHIKVTVGDRNKFWLSSGNWKGSSQPRIAAQDLNNPKITNKAGNREWHVVMQNETLATRFRNHIKADFERCKELGGTPEAVEDQVLVDVPLAVLEAIQLESPAPATIIEPLPINRILRVKPLLTPDKKGAVFSKAVLSLIRSAKNQLVFQNQYIKMSGAKSGFLKQLVDALAEKAEELDDFRIILRSGGDDMQFNLSQLKRRGIDVNNQVKILDNTHTKGIVVDGQRVLIGSHNWSSSGVTLNRDASLIFDDEEVAQYFLKAFDLDWQRARVPNFEEVVHEGVRPAEGDAPPPGYVRMTLSSYLEG